MYIGAQFRVKFINFKNKLIRLIIWDGTSEEKFRSILKYYLYQGVHGVIIMYDVCNENSFKSIRLWNKEIELKIQPEVCKVLVGNNCHEQDRNVSEEEGRKIADDFNMHFFEASSVTNQNINEVFYYLIEEILKIPERKNFQKNKNENNSKNKKDRELEKKSESNCSII